MFDWLRRLFRGSVAGPVWIEASELRRRLTRGNAPMVIDVRGPDEFDGPLGHIAVATNIPLPTLSARAADLARLDCPIVLVCLTDKRSSQAAAELAAAGARDVAVLRGGMRAWRR